MACIVCHNGYCQNYEYDYYTPPKKYRLDIDDATGLVEFTYAYSFDSSLKKPDDMIVISLGALVPLISPNLRVGAGLGFCSIKDKYDDEKYKSSVPIYLITNIVLWDTPKVSPYADIRLGYNIGYQSGLYFSSGLGLLFKTDSEFSFYVTCGYTLLSGISNFSPDQGRNMMTIRLALGF